MVTGSAPRTAHPGPDPRGAAYGIDLEEPVQVAGVEADRASEGVADGGLHPAHDR